MVYIVNFIAKELQLYSFTITSSREEFKAFAGPRINYSPDRITADELWIQPHGLLHEKDIREQQVRCVEINNNKAFFTTSGDFPFDVFAAAFYLLSRYEEYLPHRKDMYGRYAYENSVAFRENFLQTPLVNNWLLDLKNVLLARFPALQAGNASFTLLPTYDIDIAWSYQYKGWWRNAGGLLRSLLKGQWWLAGERIRVLRGKEKDPFDSFGWLHQLHERFKLKPYYFFLVPQKRGRYDKNISPACPAMQQLIRDHVIRYPIGIHPSWISGDDTAMLKKEIDTLSVLNGNPVSASRQHYIRFNLPDGYRRLIDHGIRFDFSMGYGSINGFRASIASPFYWYDLEKEEQTELLLFPFCFMEANSFYEQKYSANQALEEMRHYFQAVKAVNGYFIMIWHNSFLGTDRLFKGWKEVYEQFITEVTGTAKPAT